jgi:hypothetical protein
VTSPQCALSALRFPVEGQRGLRTFGQFAALALSRLRKAIHFVEASSAPRTSGSHLPAVASAITFRSLGSNVTFFHQ